MFYFPCAECGTPLPISEVQSWLGGDALCGAGCADAAVGSGRYDRPTDPRLVISETLALLADTGDQVRRAAGQAHRAESSLHTAAALGSFGAHMAFGALPGAIAGAVSDAASDGFSGRVSEIDQSLHRIVRKMMVLESLGFGVAQHLGPFVAKFGGLSGTSAGGMDGVLRHLWEHLEFLHNGVGQLSPPS